MPLHLKQLKALLALLRGDIDVLSTTGMLTLVMGNERRNGSLSAGVQIGLGDTHPDRWAVVITSQGKRTARREDDEVRLMETGEEAVEGGEAGRHPADAVFFL